MAGAPAARVAVVGAGWAGLAAAVRAVQAGHAVTLLEAARTLGGRARSLDVALPTGGSLVLDNGQHILIGAYRQTLALMRTVGLAPATLLHAMPLTLRYPDGNGIALPPWPAPLDAAWGIATARGWRWRDKASLVAISLRWRRAGFACAPTASVADISAGLTPRVRAELIEPLCVSALNTPADQASGQVFLRVLQDSLFAPRDAQAPWPGAWLLLPKVPLGALFPQAASAWLQARGAQVRLGHRVTDLARSPQGWQVDGEPFDSVVLAAPAPEAARLARLTGAEGAAWAAKAQRLRHEAIATVYVSGGPRLAQPMLALYSDAAAPAQFVFDRAQLGGPDGVLAFVVSAARGERAEIEHQVLAQAAALGWRTLTPLQTVLEKRATFACTTGQERPVARVADGLSACGDYVAGPYPATLEQAVMSASAAVQSSLEQRHVTPSS